MIAVFYTGDVRHNQSIAKQNHEKLFARLRELIDIKIYKFTRDDPERGSCPYDPPIDQADPDNNYRRGQGGAVQVWDFIRGVDRTVEPFVLRLRTDVWFTDTSINCICNEVKEMLAGNSDISYFGSDWINENAGAIDKRLEIDINADSQIQDFVVLAKREKLVPFNQVIEHIDKVNPNKRRSGNKIFRYIIPVDLIDGAQIQRARVFRTLCQIWLIRKTYNTYPSDDEVCKDYIQSYIADDKNRPGKKSLIVPHPMQDAVNWWREQQGWKKKDIAVGRWHEWQLA